VKLYDDPQEEGPVWEIRESGLGATAWVPGEPVTWEGWEDSAVPPDKIGAYLRQLCELYEKHGYEGALYGHFGQGCIHTRITFDLVTAEGIANYRSFMEEATSLVVKYGGSLSGEHGEGRVFVALLRKPAAAPACLLDGLDSPLSPSGFPVSGPCQRRGADAAGQVDRRHSFRTRRSAICANHFFARTTFKDWFQRRGTRNQGKPEVILWADTFNNYFHPEVAAAATEVLEDVGFLP
jgi:hypothetical protein